jgi:hypothetical protein
MRVPPNDRIELVLMSNQAAPVHLWVQSTANTSRRVELDKDRSVRVIGASAFVLLFMLYFFPGAAVIILLIGLMVGFPLTLVGMAGVFRKS